MSLLSLTGQIIPWHTVSLTPAVEQKRNDAGQTYSERCSAISVRGRLISLTRRMKEDAGLEFKTNYLNFLVPSSLDHLTRSNIGSATFNFKGRTYQVQTPTDNYDTLGWDRYLCVEVPFISDVPSPYSKSYSNSYA